MAEAGFIRPTRSNGTAITIVVLMHATVLTAVALSKMDVIRIDRDPIKVINIKKPPVPPVEPPPPDRKQVVEEPQHVSHVTVTPPIIPTPSETAWKVEPMPPTPFPPLGKVAEVTIDPAPAPPPPAKKLEPARAKANLASYVSDSDYPAAAVRAEEQGTAGFRLSVGPDGRVTDCTIIGSSGSSALDSATCRIMEKRARFTPARDSDGRVASDSVASAIRWVLPE
jgi:protein TonB